jgi:Ca-activated chloride channel homolog
VLCPVEDLRFALAVAGYGMLLRESPFKGRLTYDDVLALARESIGDDAEHYRADFVSLVEATKKISSQKVASAPVQRE